MRKSYALISVAMMTLAPSFAFAQQTDGGPSKGTAGAAMSAEPAAPAAEGRSSYSSDHPMTPSEVPAMDKTNPKEPVTQTDR